MRAAVPRILAHVSPAPIVEPNTARPTMTASMPVSRVPANHPTNPLSTARERPGPDVAPGEFVGRGCPQSAGRGQGSEGGGEGQRVA